MRKRAGIVAVLFGALAMVAADRFFAPNLPYGGDRYARVVTDRHGRPLRAFADSRGVWRYPVKLNQVSPLYLQALTHYEDRWFWWHPGVNPLSMSRAAYQRVRYGRFISGGSTLTMQVARLLHPNRRTIGGKMSQMLRALQLEWRLDKTEILELYLNLAPFGGPLEGVQAASFAYLGKSAAKLTHAEAALLAVLPQRPSALRPDRYPERARQARDKVLARLANFEVWSGDAVGDALAEPIDAVPLRAPVLAPLLARRLVDESPGRQVVQTTVDAEIQSALQDYLEAYIETLPKDNSAAILVVENATLAVRAYLGSARFGDPQRFGHVDMVRAVRSPGSTLKPLLYGLAIDDGLIHSHSLLADAPGNFSGYRPANFSPGFSGPVSAASALQRSLNVPAVALLDRYGSRRFTSRLQQAGLRVAIPGGDPNLAIILGGAGVRLEDLVGAYLSFAREGRAAQPHFLPGLDTVDRYLMSPEAAWVTAEIMRGTPRPSRLRTLRATGAPPDLAWKTGTSYGFRDAWALGVNKDYTIGVWVGRPDGTPSPGQYGAATAAPLLFTVANYLPPLDSQPVPQPPGVTRTDICWPLGIAAARQAPELCQQVHRAWVVRDQIPPTGMAYAAAGWTSNPLRVWLNADTGKRIDATCGAERRVSVDLPLWPLSLEPWIAPAQRRAALFAPADSTCDRPPLLSVARIRIRGLEQGDILGAPGGKGPLPQVTLHADGGAGARLWFVDGELKKQTQPGQPFLFRTAEQGRHRIVVVDAHGNTDLREFTVGF